jgi:hypothetical protein
VHDYVTDPELFLDASVAPDEAARMLIGILSGLREEAGRLGLP